MIYGRKWQEYASQWNKMIINADRVAEATRAAEYAIAHKDIYRQIEIATNVPWVMVACDHRRESDAQDKQGNPLFTSYLGNGQPLWIKTTIVPIGRGPFIDSDYRLTKEPLLGDRIIAAFIAGAQDAYHIDKMDQVKDWRLEKMLYYQELFNGAGYDTRGLPSPYLWGGTNIQKAGKFIADHRFNTKSWDKQLGAAPIMRKIAELDTSVKYERES